jgi:hypothetical protein
MYENIHYYQNVFKNILNIVDIQFVTTVINWLVFRIKFAHLSIVQCRAILNVILWNQRQLFILPKQGVEAEVV